MVSSFGLSTKQLPALRSPSPNVNVFSVKLITRPASGRATQEKAMAKKAKEPKIERVSTFRTTEIKQVGSGRRKLDEIVNFHKFEKDWSIIRLIGGNLELQQMWIDILPKDGDTVISVGRRVEDVEDNPYLELPNSKRPQIAYFNNAILRGKKYKDKHKPSKAEVKAGHLIVEENTGSPVVVVRFPSGVATKVKEIAEMGDYDISDENEGVDLHVRCDRKAPPALMYSVQRGDKSPLSKREKEFLLWPLDQVEPWMSKDEVKDDVERLRKQCPPDDKKPEKKDKKKKDKAPF